MNADAHSYENCFTSHLRGEAEIQMRLQGLRPRTPGIYRMVAAGSAEGYIAGTAAEDTALLGSNRSAAAVAIRHERRPIRTPLFCCACRRPQGDKSRGCGGGAPALHLGIPHRLEKNLKIPHCISELFAS